MVDGMVRVALDVHHLTIDYIDDKTAPGCVIGTDGAVFAPLLPERDAHGCGERNTTIQGTGEDYASHSGA